MRLCLYAHPFDLQAMAAIGGLSRLRDLGFDEVAMATSYHDGRWLQPWHPGGRVRFLEDGTVHFRPRGEYGTLRPLMSSQVPASGPSPLEQFATEAGRHGLAVRAWTVFTHNSRLGAQHPDVCVHNAFGDRYAYALCPTQGVVQQYIAAMVGDLAGHAGMHTIELEALGQMGWKHSSHHDKASFAPAGLLDAALSVCFCSACAAAFAAAGHDAVALRDAVRTFVATHVEQACAMTPGKVPGGPADLAAAGLRVPWLDAVLAVRGGVVQALAKLVARSAGGVALAAQVHPHPWFTGSQLATGAATAFPREVERVLTCYGENVEAIARLLAHEGMAAAADSPRRVCFWPKAPQFRGDEDLAQLRAVCEQHGITSLAVYHLGLLPWRTIERVAKMLRR